MAYSVDLALSATTAAVIDMVCDRLEEDPKIETYRRLGTAPHVSLGVYDNVDVRRFGDAAAAFARTISPISVHLGAIGVFCHETSVLFIAPVVTGELLALHERFHREFEAFNETCWNYYCPGNWVPHITLAMNLSAAPLADAITKVAPIWREHDATLDRLRFVSHPPFHLLAEHRLSEAAKQ